MYIAHTIVEALDVVKQLGFPLHVSPAGFPQMGATVSSDSEYQELVELCLASSPTATVDITKP